MIRIPTPASWGQMCGHYTQVVWRNSVRLGCARVQSNSGWWFIACNYDPPGNYIAQPHPPRTAHDLNVETLEVEVGSARKDIGNFEGIIELKDDIDFLFLRLQWEALSLSGQAASMFMPLSQ
ncbi:hypothetical protein RJ639_023346, partial [Escallonia herrerae]